MRQESGFGHDDDEQVQLKPQGGFSNGRIPQNDLIGATMTGRCPETSSSEAVGT